jgi:hypothetical protein
LFAGPSPYQAINWALLQFGVLGLGVFKHGNFSIGVFPESEEVLACGAGTGRVARKYTGARHIQMRERPNKTGYCNPGMIDNLLKFCGCGGTLFAPQIAQPATQIGIRRKNGPASPIPPEASQ